MREGNKESYEEDNEEDNEGKERSYEKSNEEDGVIFIRSVFRII